MARRSGKKNGEYAGGVKRSPVFGTVSESVNEQEMKKEDHKQSGAEEDAKAEGEEQTPGQNLQ